MQRIDVYPTHVFEGFKLRPGRPFPFGAHLVPGGINFSVFSRHASYCTLVLFERGAPMPFVEIPFRGAFLRADTGESVWGEFRIGNVFTMTVFDLDHENLEYGYRMDGRTVPSGRSRGIPAIHRFDPSTVLLDPYARAIGGRDVWGEQPDWNDPFQHRGRIVHDDFDWEGDRPLEIPLEDLVVYEMHVRGFTRHPSSGIRHPGHVRGPSGKDSYLKELGVNCVELMPIFEFDEFENSRNHSETGEMLVNFWGYSSVGFFAPKAGFAATGRTRDATMVADELKTMVRELHSNGIEVQCTGCRSSTTPLKAMSRDRAFLIREPTTPLTTCSRRRVSTSISAAPATRSTATIRSCATWCSTRCATGPRNTILTVSVSTSPRFSAAMPDGYPLANPPLLETLAFDPVLGKCKLVAEAWDAGGLYQVGSFPAYGRWAEWNGRYRDSLRRFLKGDGGQSGRMASAALMGSPDLYSGRGLHRLHQISSHATTDLLSPIWSLTTTSTTRPTARTTTTAATTITRGTAASRVQPMTPGYPRQNN